MKYFVCETLEFSTAANRIYDSQGRNQLNYYSNNVVCRKHV